MSSRLRLYSDASSNHAQFVLFTLALKKKTSDVDFIAMDWMNKQKELTDVNPFGNIPTLIDGDYGLYESRAICRYIDDKFPQSPRLLPTDIKQRGLVEQWCSVEYCAYSPELVKLIIERIWGPMFHQKKSDEAKCKEIMVKLKKTLTIIDNHLSKSKYFVGDSITFADVCFAPLTHEALGTPEKAEILDAHPHFSAWWTRISESDAWKVVLKAVADNRVVMEENLRLWKESEAKKQKTEGNTI